MEKQINNFNIFNKIFNIINVIILYFEIQIYDMN